MGAVTLLGGLTCLLNVFLWQTILTFQTYVFKTQLQLLIEHPSLSGAVTETLICC